MLKKNSEEKNASNNEVDFKSDTTCLYFDQLYLLSCSKKPRICCQKCRSRCHLLCTGIDARKYLNVRSAI